jgi:hypothetical protein
VRTNLAAGEAYRLLLFFIAIGLTNERNTQTTTCGGLTGVVTNESKAVVPDADKKRSPWGV